MSDEQLIKEVQEAIEKLKVDILQKENVVTELLQQIEEQSN